MDKLRAELEGMIYEGKIKDAGTVREILSKLDEYINSLVPEKLKMTGTLKDTATWGYRLGFNDAVKRFNSNRAAPINTKSLRGGKK